VTNENESIEKKLRRFREVEPPVDLLEKIHSAIPAELGSASARGAHASGVPFGSRPSHRTNRWLPIAAALSIALLSGIFVWRSDLRSSRVISTSEMPAAVSSSAASSEAATEAARADSREVDLATEATSAATPSVPYSAPTRQKKDQADGATSLADAATAEVRTEAVNAAPANDLEEALSVTANSPQVAQAAAPAPPAPATPVARRNRADVSATAAPADAMLEVQKAAEDSSRDRIQNQAAVSISGISAESLRSFRNLASIRGSLDAGVLPQGIEVDALAIAQNLLASRPRASELKIVATRSPFRSAGIIALVTGPEKVPASPSKLERSSSAANPQGQIAGDAAKRNSPELTRVFGLNAGRFFEVRRGTSVYRIKASDVESWKDADPELRLAVTTLYLGELLASGSTDAAEWNRLLDQAEKLPKTVRDEQLIAVIRKAKQLVSSR